MSATVLSTRSLTSDQIYASGALLGRAGLVSTGDLNCANVVATNDVEANTLTILQTANIDGTATLGAASITDGGVAISDSLSNGSASVTMTNLPTLPLTSQGAKLNVLSTGPLEGLLTVFTLNTAGAQVQTIASSQVPPRGVVGPPVVAGTQAIWGMVAPSQSGTAIIANGSQNIIVANTAITANSIIMVSGNGVVNATAEFFTTTVQVGVSFTISANAAATVADVGVNWFIVHY